MKDWDSLSHVICKKAGPYMSRGKTISKPPYLNLCQGFSRPLWPSWSVDPASWKGFIGTNQVWSPDEERVSNYDDTRGIPSSIFCIALYLKNHFILYWIFGSLHSFIYTSRSSRSSYLYIHIHLPRTSSQSIPISTPSRSLWLHLIGAAFLRGMVA